MEKKNKKEWIKNAIIVFLVIMLIFTFCSDSIMNMYLPEVSTEAVASGKLQESVRGSGNAELGSGYLVKIKESRTIKSVNVKTGQTVKPGDVLFTLEASDGTELDTAKSTYLDLQTDYQKKLLGTDHNYDKDSMAIKAAKAEYDKAVDNLNRIEAKKKSIKAKQKALKSCEGKIAKYEEKITDYDTKINDLATKTDAASAQADLLSKQRILAGLNNELSDINADLQALKNAGADAAEITVKERERRDKALEVSNAKNDVSIAENTVNEIAANITCLANYTSKRTTANKKLTTYKNNQQTLSGELETLKTGLMTREEAEAAVTEKENAWNSLLADLEAKKAEDSHTDESDKIELNAARQKLVAQKKLVEDLMASSQQTEIKAEQEGIVSSIDIAAGDSTQPDTPIATIASSSEGYTVKFSVTKEQAVKVKAGQKAEVENYYGDECKAVLSKIEADPENPGYSILTFSVSGSDINTGDSLTISVGGESKAYDVICPKSSIYEDNNGKFVLTLESKNTPLGNRYIAVRHEVDVLAENDTKAAISSDLYGYEYVIVTASEALTPGQQVKLKEE